MQKELTCCFTGHRLLSASPLLVQEALRESIETLILQGFINFESGGALGFDLLAAKTVLSLKKKHPHIRLFMVLPCPEQDRFWTSAQQAEYRTIIAEADKTVYTADYYHRGCMLKRNRYLVDSAACVLAYLERNFGGTKYTVDYAEKTGIPVLFLNPKLSPSEQLSLFA